MVLPSIIYYIEAVRINSDSIYADTSYVVKALDTKDYSDFTFGKFISNTAVDSMWFNSKDEAEQVAKRLIDSKHPAIYKRYYIGALYNNNVYLCKGGKMVDFSGVNINIDLFDDILRLYPSSDCPEILADLKEARETYKDVYDSIGIDLWIRKDLDEKDQCIWYAIFDKGQYKVLKENEFDKNLVERILTKGTLADCNEFITGKTNSWIEEPNMDKAIKLYFSNNKSVSPEDIATDFAIWGQKHRA